MNDCPTGRSDARTIRVLIADDHAVVREGLRAFIAAQRDMCVVAEAENGAEAVSLHLRHRPDVCILDLRMPLLSGWDIIRAVRAKTPQSRFVVFTAHDSQEEVFRAIDAGAYSYVLKHSDPAELIRAVREAHAGRRYISPAISDRLLARYHGTGLTERERHILALMVTGETNQSIAARLGVRADTVKGHVSSIIEKLGVSNRTQAATRAIRLGLIQLD